MKLGLQIGQFFLMIVRPPRPTLVPCTTPFRPFAGADALRVLPDHAGRELLEGLSAFRACGFHNRRWASNFEWSCAERSEEHTSELQSRQYIVCRLLLATKHTR